MNAVKIQGITYQVVKRTSHPEIVGRSLLILRRPRGRMSYVCTEYEGGGHSAVAGNSFCAVRRGRA